MEIRQITEDKDNYLEMLLIADPQENMIRRYLDKSDMFVLEDAGEKSRVKQNKTRYSVHTVFISSFAVPGNESKGVYP